MEPIKFLHIGKTGGSAISQAIRPYSDKIISIGHNGHHLYNPLNDGIERKTINGNFCFFIRDPVSRFVSGFVFVKRWIEFEKKPVDPHVLEFFQRYETPNALGIELDQPQVQKLVLRIPHIRTFLSTYVDLDNDRDKIVFVGRFERLEEDFEKLKIIANLPSDLKLEHYGGTQDYNSIKELSLQAIENIKKYYQSDYDFINKVSEIGRISG